MSGASPVWYELGLLYAGAAGDGRRASALGFAVACAAGALVLLSAPLFGTAWAGPFAAAIPVIAGLLSAATLFAWRRLRFRRGREALRRALAALDEDADRPTAGGLSAYYDAQLVLLRCEYEYLRSRGTRRAPRSVRLFEQAFGFTPEDPFECGPLSARPETEEMRLLRGRWEGRLVARGGLGMRVPALGLREDLAYRVFPREMTVPLELATRAAYLGISCRLMRERYGRGARSAPEEVRRRAEKDLTEYRAIVER